MSGHVFISHAAKDRDYAQRLADSLKGYGIPVWVDDKIDYGTEWPRVIQEQIDTCKAFVVLMSSSSYDSTWVQNELTRAARKGKPIFPILIDGKTWLSIESVQFTDARDGKIPAKRFFERIASVVFGETISVEIPKKEKVAPPPPYQGTKKYIFLSYKREEIDVIAPYLQSVNNWGFPLWYDAGIPGGADWLNLIQTKVSACRLMLVFLSPAAVNSQWVRKEVFLAATLEKPIIAVKLEEVELLYGLGLVLVSSQHLEIWSNPFLPSLKDAIQHHY